MRELTLLEQIVLSAVWSLGDGAYGVAVRKKLKTLVGKNINYGTLYNALEQLQRKGYITKTEGESAPERVGRPRIFYRPTPEGKEALWKTYELQKTIWSHLSDFVEDFKS
jgi:DNA-binding PadR family transcriptional regulator